MACAEERALARLLHSVADATERFEAAQRAQARRMLSIMDTYDVSIGVASSATLLGDRRQRGRRKTFSPRAKQGARAAKGGVTRTYGVFEPHTGPGLREAQRAWDLWSQWQRARGRERKAARSRFRGYCHRAGLTG